MPITPHQATLCESFSSCFEQFVALLDFARSAHGSTLAALENGLLERGFELLRSLLEQTLASAALAHDAQLVVPPGGRARIGQCSKETLFGRINFARTGVQPTRDARLVFGFDAQLALAPSLYSPGVQQRVARDATMMSFAEAGAELECTTAAHVPQRQLEATVADAADDVGAFYALPLPADDPPAVVANDVGSTRLIGSVDATGIVMRTEALRDATRKAASARDAAAPRHRDPYQSRPARDARKRMAVVFAVWSQTTTPRTALDILRELRPEGAPAPVRLARPTNKRLSASLVTDTRTEIKAMFDEFDRRDPSDNEQVVVLVDGSEPIIAGVTREASRRKRPVSVVLDVIHVLHWLWKIAKARDDDEQTREAWVGVALERLLTQPWEATRRYLRYQAQGRSEAVKAAVSACLNYLDVRARYIDYRAYLAAGLPIATGVIEGACRHLVKDRMDTTGARWGLAGAEAMLKLRAVVLNGDWDAYWAFHLEQERQRTYLKQAA